MFQKSTEKTNPNKTKFHTSINRKQKLIFQYVLEV